jgi:hypothetical protein
MCLLEGVNGFIGHLHISVGTSSKYSAIVDLYTLQITIAHTESSPACNVFNSRFLVTDVNNGDSSSSRAQVLPVLGSNLGRDTSYNH